MGLFDKLFGTEDTSDTTGFSADAPPAERTGKLGVLVPVFTAKVSEARIAKNMKRLNAPVPNIGLQTLSGAGRLDIDGQLVDFILIEAPLPQSLLDYICQVTHWSDGDKAILRKHSKHFIAWYAGNADPVTAYVTLMKAAWALAGPEMTGVVMEDAVNFLPPKMVTHMLSKETIPTLYKSVPVGMLTGFLKFFGEHGTWCATRGHEVFGVPNFAMWVAPPKQPSDALDIFGPLFNYAYSAKVVFNEGETMELAGQLFRFERVVEFREYVESPYGETLVLTPIDHR